MTLQTRVLFTTAVCLVLTAGTMIRINRSDTAGTALASIPDSLIVPKSLCYDHPGKQVSARVRHWDPEINDTLSWITSVAQHPDGRIFALNPMTSILVWNDQGRHVDDIYPRQLGLGDLTSVTAIGFDSIGNLYVLDSQKDLRAFDGNLMLLRTLKLPFKAWDFAFSSNGRLFIAGSPEFQDSAFAPVPYVAALGADNQWEEVLTYTRESMDKRPLIAPKWNLVRLTPTRSGSMIIWFPYDPTFQVVQANGHVDRPVSACFPEETLRSYARQRKAGLKTVSAMVQTAGIWENSDGTITMASIDPTARKVLLRHFNDEGRVDEVSLFSSDGDLRRHIHRYITRLSSGGLMTWGDRGKRHLDSWTVDWPGATR